MYNASAKADASMSIVFEQLSIFRVAKQKMLLGQILQVHSRLSY